MIRSPPVPISDVIAITVRNHIRTSGAFASFFSPTAVLVPVPKSTLWKEGSLWVPDQLARSLIQVGLGARVARLLERTEAIPKAATSISSERPTAHRHYQTLAVQEELASIPDIVLVDDVVTRGDTLLGSANRLRHSYPNVAIRGFAAIRTMSGSSGFKEILDPVTGWIRLLSNDHCQRRP